MIEKVRINIIGDTFWFQPSIMTMSKRKWVDRPYKNFKKLLMNENLYDKNFILSLNGDRSFKFFRMCCQYKNIETTLSKNILLEIQQKGFYDYTFNKKYNFTLRFDSKALKVIKKGFIPFNDLDYIKNNIVYKKKDHEIFLWRKSGWKIENAKKA